MAHHTFLGWAPSDLASATHAPAALLSSNAFTSLAARVQAAAHAIGWKPLLETNLNHDIPEPDREYHLFREEDLSAWIIFTVVFFFLVIFDNAVLNRQTDRMSFSRALAFVCFWILCAVGFAVYIYISRGLEDAFDWATGYLLEWMLSIDNLFVFHLIFQKFATPDHLKHKPLFWGIVGAIIFRMIFFIIEEIAIHHFWWMHVIFAIFLIYTGIRTAYVDEEDEDPAKNVFFIWLSKRIPFVNGYDPKGAFFIRCKVNPVTGDVIVPRPMTEPSEPDAVSQYTEHTDEQSAMVLDPSDYYWSPQASHEDLSSAGREAKSECRATLLVMVIICLEITDVIFAIDSVSAIVAQIPDLYLAYTACVFAMLGLRATFFVIDELVKIFTLLKYGVSLTLIFIGIKLILKGFIHIHPALVFCVLVFFMSSSMVLSVVYDKYRPA